MPLACHKVARFVPVRPFFFSRRLARPRKARRVKRHTYEVPIRPMRKNYVCLPAIFRALCPDF